MMKEMGTTMNACIMGREKLATAVRRLMLGQDIVRDRNVKILARVYWY